MEMKCLTFLSSAHTFLLRNKLLNILSYTIFKLVLELTLEFLLYTIIDNFMWNEFLISRKNNPCFTKLPFSMRKQVSYVPFSIWTIYSSMRKRYFVVAKFICQIKNTVHFIKNCEDLHTVCWNASCIARVLSINIYIFFFVPWSWWVTRKVLLDS